MCGVVCIVPHVGCWLVDAALRCLRCLLFATRRLLFVVCCSPCVVCCLLFAVSRLMCVVCCVLSSVYRVLCACVCWSLSFMYKLLYAV